MLNPRVWALDVSVPGSYERFIDFSKKIPLFHDHFVHKHIFIRGNVTKPNRENKNALIRGNVTKPEKS